MRYILIDLRLVEFIYLVFTHMSGESYRRRLWSLLLCLYDVFHTLINSLVSWVNGLICEAVWSSGKESLRPVSRRTSVRRRLGFSFSSKVVVCGHGTVCVGTLTINENIKMAYIAVHLHAGFILVLTM